MRNREGAIDMAKTKIRGVADGGVGGVVTPPLLKTGDVDPPTFCDAEYAFLAFMSVKQASATPTNTSDSESLQELPKAN